MFTISQAFYAFFAALCAIAILLLLGRGLKIAVFKLFRVTEPAVVPLYWELFAGMAFTVGVFAAMRTGGLTILLPILVLVPGMLLLVGKRQNAPEQFRLQRSIEWKVLGLATVVQFLFFCLSLVSFNPEKVKYLSGDFNIYNRIANRLYVAGVEAYNFNIDPATFKVPTPYHFGDIWLYGLSNRLVSSNPSLSFMVAFTVMSVVFTMGLICFIHAVFAPRLTGKKQNLLLLLVASGLFAGISVCFPSFLKAYAEPYTLAIFSWGKVLMISSAMVGVLAALSNRNYLLASFALSVAAMLYINAAPAMFGAAFLVFALLLLRRRITFKSFLSYNIIYVGISGAWAVFLYKVYPMLSHRAVVATGETGNSGGFLHGMSTGKYIKTAVNIFIGGWFQLFTMLPYLILLLCFVWISAGKNGIKRLLKIDNPGVLFLPFLFVAGLGSWAAMFPIAVDSVQFFHNMLAPLYAFLIALGLIYILSGKGGKAIGLVFGLVCVFGIAASCRSVFYAGEFDKRSHDQMVDFIPKAGPHRFINIRAIKNFGYWATKKTDQYLPLGILCYWWTDYHNVCLNTPYIPVSEGVYAFEEANEIKGTSFSLYRQKQLAAGISSEQEIMEHFVADYKPNYVLVSQDTSLPAWLVPHAVDSLALNFEDGYTVYKLK